MSCKKQQCYSFVMVLNDLFLAFEAFSFIFIFFCHCHLVVCGYSVTLFSVFSFLRLLWNERKKESKDRRKTECAEQYFYLTGSCISCVTSGRATVRTQFPRQKRLKHLHIAASFAIMTIDFQFDKTQGRFFD